MRYFGQDPDFQSPDELLDGQIFAQFRFLISCKGPAAISVEQEAEALLCGLRGTESQDLLGSGSRSQKLIYFIPDVKHCHGHGIFPSLVVKRCTFAVAACSSGVHKMANHDQAAM